MSTKANGNNSDIMIILFLSYAFEDEEITEDVSF